MILPEDGIELPSDDSGPPIVPASMELNELEMDLLLGLNLCGCKYNCVANWGKVQKKAVMDFRQKLHGNKAESNNILFTAIKD